MFEKYLFQLRSCYEGVGFILLFPLQVNPLLPFFVRNQVTVHQLTVLITYDVISFICIVRSFVVYKYPFI